MLSSKVLIRLACFVLSTLCNIINVTIFLCSTASVYVQLYPVVTVMKDFQLSQASTEVNGASTAVRLVCMSAVRIGNNCTMHFSEYLPSCHSQLSF